MLYAIPIKHVVLLLSPFHTKSITTISITTISERTCSLMVGRMETTEPSANEGVPQIVRKGVSGQLLSWAGRAEKLQRNVTQKEL